MGTSFDDVIDMGLITIQDYKLDNLLNINNGTAFQTFCDGLLIRSLPTFYQCVTDLSYDATSRTFTNILSSLEISILADIFVYTWFERVVNNITQIENKMSPSDFKHYSEAENLKQKSEYKDKMREMYSQKINEYLHLNADWSSMASGDFGV